MRWAGRSCSVGGAWLIGRVGLVVVWTGRVGLVVWVGHGSSYG